MLHSYASARLPTAQGALAKHALGCPSAGGQRITGLSYRVLSRGPERASEYRMAERFVQRLQGRQGSLQWLLAGAVTCARHRRPNPSVKRTPNGGPRSAVSGEAVPPLVALTSNVRRL